MALDWVKEQADKAIKAAGEATTALVHEVQTIEHKLAGSEPKAEVKTGSIAVPQIKELNPNTITTNSAIGSLIGYLGAPIVKAGATIGSECIKIAENVFQTADKKLTVCVGEIVGKAAEEIKAEYNKLFDTNPDKTQEKAQPVQTIEFNNIFDKGNHPEVQRVSSVSNQNGDMLRWLYTDKEQPRNVAVSDNLFSYTNDKHEQTDISALPGHVHIEKKDSDGNLKTIVDKTSNRTMVLHGSESVVIENGKEVVKGDGYKVTWDEKGRRHIMLDNGSELVRDGDKVQLINETGTLDVQKHVLNVGGTNISFVDGKDPLKEMTQEKQKSLKPGEAALIAIKGAGTRTIFSDGTTFDVQDNLARLETKDHRIFQFEIKDNQIFLRRDDKLIPLDNEQSLIKAENGKFKIGGLVIDPAKLSIESESAPAAAPGTGGEATPPHPQYRFDLSRHIQSLLDQHGNPWAVTVDHNNSTTVEDPAHQQKIANNNLDSTVAVTTVVPATPEHPQPVPETVKIDLSTTTVDLNNKVVDEPNKTTIKDSNTVIDKDRTVHLGGDDGPVVRPDGSVRVDRNTYVDRDMTVHSNDWSSTAARTSGSASVMNAQIAAMNISNKASSMTGVAKSDKIRWSEVAVMNNALGDVLSLMGSVPSDSPAYAMLLSSYGLLVEAINDATPKAQVTESAIAQGITSQIAIKAMEQGATEEEVKRNRLAA